MTRKSANSSHVTFVLPSFTAGGAERVLITLMNGLDAEKFHKELIVLKDEGHLRDLVSAGIPVSTLTGKNNFLTSILFRVVRFWSIGPHSVGQSLFSRPFW